MRGRSGVRGVCDALARKETVREHDRPLADCDGVTIDETRLSLGYCTCGSY
jgi:hypothetical protein